MVKQHVFDSNNGHPVRGSQTPKKAMVAEG